MFTSNKALEYVSYPTQVRTCALPLSIQEKKNKVFLYVAFPSFSSCPFSLCVEDGVFGIPTMKSLEDKCYSTLFRLCTAFGRLRKSYASVKKILVSRSLKKKNFLDASLGSSNACNVNLDVDLPQLHTGMSRRSAHIILLSSHTQRVLCSSSKLSSNWNLVFIVRIKNTENKSQPNKVE